MKKTLLFVIDSLDCAGAEKSLVTLLSLLDYTKYSVDLRLFAYGKLLEDFVPREVNILPPLEYTRFAELSLKQAFMSSLRKLNFKMLWARVKYSLRIRIKKYSNPQKARIFWESVADVVESHPKHYDVAISYAQGIPTFYVAEKVQANKKFAWVNVSYRLKEKDKEFQKRFYTAIDRIVAVSDSTCDILLEGFPEFSGKVKIIYDINNPGFISKMAANGKTFNDKYEGIRLLTIGRLAHQKGYDIALNACKMLKAKGLKFRWYALGKGPLRKEIEQFIQDNNLTEEFVLLGVEPNPYPFIKDSDIYIQTSRFEGYGIAIAEARMLNIPVVTTRFDAVFSQMVDGKNGLVVDMSPEAICDGILKLISDQDLRENIIDYLKKEPKGNVDEVAKFYELVD